MKIRIAVTGFCIVLVIIVSAFGQMTSLSGRIGPGTQLTASMMFGDNGIPYMTPPVAGAPYSGTQINQRIQTLPDGTKLTSEGAVLHVYRDAAGRTRTERPVAVPSSIKNPPYIVEINDTIANQKIVLDTVNRVAHRTAMQPFPDNIKDSIMAGLSGVPLPADNRPGSTTEQLGQKMIDGLVVVGWRRSNIVPAGAMGNDRALTITTEFWVSPELKVPLLTKALDPRIGEMIIALTDISRAEPDAVMFQIPEDYQVIDETLPFTIKVTIPQQ